jgi:hypothetical protein
MNDETHPTHITPEPGRFQFWLDKHPGQRPPEWLIPEWLKSTYAEWDEAPARVEVPQLALLEAVSI